MRKFIGYILCWMFYWLGDLLSKPVYYSDWFVWLYPAYNNLMLWSTQMQDWSGAKGPWGPPNYQEWDGEE